MRSLLRSLCLFAIIVLTGHAASSQVTLSVTALDSCYYGLNGTNVFFGINLSGPSVNQVLNIENNYGDGTKDVIPANFGSTGFRTFSTHFYTSAGTYSVKFVALGSGGARIDSITQTLSVYCSFIGGDLYNDANSNCLKDATEPLIRALASIRVDSAGVPVDTLQAIGSFRYKARAASTTTYTFTLLGNPAGYVKACPSTGIISYTFSPGLNSIPPQNFGFNCSSTPSYDYQLSYYKILRGASSPGPSFIGLIAQNTSCHSGTGTVTLNVSPKYNITSSGISPAPSSVSGNTVTWSIPGMMLGNITYLYVPLTPKSTTNNGDTACNYALITPTSGDSNPANNSAGGCDSVRASWDPNDKSVVSSGPVVSGATLTYTINFENLGNDTAFNIHVMDTLSQNLDMSSFALLSATHRVVPNAFTDDNGYAILRFDFPNIRLADKTRPAANKGQVRFSVKLRNNIPSGTSIANRAGIYFDGNPVVLTNYAYVRTPAPQGVSAQNRQAIRIFPNPAGAALQIQLDAAGWDEAVLTNTLGQTVLKSKLVLGGNELNTSTIAAGIYYLQVRGANGSITEKIEKQ